MRSGKSTPLGYWTAVVAVIGGFLQGYTTSVIAGAILFIDKEFHLNSFLEGGVASIVVLGALVGSLCAGLLADKLGRRNSLQLSAFFFFVSGMGALFIDSFSVLLLIRLVAGVAAGMASILVPLYLGEIAPAAQRGAFVAAYVVAVTFGILTAYLIGYSLSSTENWRFMLAFSALPAGLQSIALFFFPKSPKWLFVQGQEKEGRKMLQKLHGENFHIPPLLMSTKFHSKWKDLFSPSVRLVLSIGIILSIFQQLSGINAIIYFTPKIFEAAGFLTKQALFSTLFIGAIYMICTSISMFLIDRLGRRKLLLISQGGIILILSFLSLVFVTKNAYLDYLSVPALIVYVGIFALGVGPIVWVVIAEIYPLYLRAKAIAAMTFLSWLANYLIVLTFPTFLSKVGCAFPFFLYALLSLGAFFFFLFYLPETKGKTLEEIEHTLIKKDYHR